jgi:flagellar biosynthesis chaperone FliJ
MEKNKVSEILKNPEIKSNKDLNECLDFLENEFEKTKDAVIQLTKYLDAVEESYNKINKEIGNRLVK